MSPGLSHQQLKVTFKYKLHFASSSSAEMRCIRVISYGEKELLSSNDAIQLAFHSISLPCTSMEIGTGSRTPRFSRCGMHALCCCCNQEVVANIILFFYFYSDANRVVVHRRRMAGHDYTRTLPLWKMSSININVIGSCSKNNSRRNSRWMKIEKYMCGRWGSL